MKTSCGKMTIHYMPSEIARLVLGYLRESDCKESAKVFIEESKNLTEYRNGLKHGITYSTSIGGKTLVDILNGITFDDNTDHNNDQNYSNNSVNEQITTISKQLSNVESVVTQLSQTINSNHTNYQLITSPSMVSSSSPLIVNTIGYNSTPIVLNDQNLLSVLNQSDSQSRTPPKSANNSPRRKSLPRRRIVSGSSPLKSSSVCDVSINSSQMNTSPDRDKDDSESQLKIDICEPLIQPEVIVGELINFQPLHEALAENINKIFNTSNNSEDNNDNTPKNVEQSHSQPENSERDEQNKSDHNSDPQEVQITDDVVHDIISKLESAPEYSTLLDIITEKELQMTPYKNVFSPFDTSSASSLNTPQTPQTRVSGHHVHSNSVVKNLMPDLRTPEKTVTLYAGRNSLQTPIKVTPIKVLKTNLTPCKTLIVPDFNIITSSASKLNGPIIMPKVSVTNENNFIYNNATQNSMSTDCERYSIRVQANTSTQTQFYNSNGTSIRSKGKKRVNFSKPASELQALQVKRPDLNPRKILPKPNQLFYSPIASTTITPVCVETNETIVPKQPMIKNKTHANSSEKTGHQSDRKMTVKDLNNKRSNAAVDESPNKIRATETRFPTVNILRKMNVNKFLEQIHSSQESE